MIHLDIKTPIDFPQSAVEKAAAATLARCAEGEVDLTLVISGDEEIQILNRDFLGKDRPTDVLSFPADETDPDTNLRYLGDVIISLPRAAEQALQRGHTTQAEVQLLTVHGILHLLGHDHATRDEKTGMWKLQRQVLDALGLTIDIPDV